MKKKITIKQLKQVLRDSLVVPQTIPYTANDGVKLPKRREMTDKEKGAMEAAAFCNGLRKW